MATPTDLLSALGRAYALTDVPFEFDQDYENALQAVVDAQSGVGWLVVRVEDSGFHVQDEPLLELPEGSGLLGSHLHEAGIAELRFQEPLETEIVQEFLRQVHPSARMEGVPPSARFRGFEDVLGLSFTQGKGEEGPRRGMAGGIQELFLDWRPRPTEPDVHEVQEAPGGGELEHIVEADFAELTGSVTPGEASPAADEPPGHPEDVLGADDLAGPEPRPEESVPEIVALPFVEPSEPLEPTEAERALRDHVKALTSRRDFKGLARLIENLVDPTNEGFNFETAQRLAEEFTTPAVASSIVAHLASSRDEGERARLGKVVARIGREGPPAVADALEQARDRSERRALVGAMVALGPRGFNLAQRMVEDSRWYVVRNGVSVMGEVGGREAVTHLTATLASSDARVRKETVLALAKLGGEDAASLILGMLDDPEPSVRAVACRALGVLGLQRAVRPLMNLMKDPDHEVEMEAIQALGLIGDPGPVQQIERKALGGFLAKPPPAIRKAAYRALAAIGTPRALKTLQKGAMDSDEDVKASVRALLRT